MGGEDQLWLLATGVFLAAGAIKGLAGIGLPTAAIALLTLSIDPRSAIALILFPMLFSNGWQMYRAGEVARTVRRYWVFAVVLGTGVGIATVLAADVPERGLLTALGVVILIFVVVSFVGWVPRLPDRFDRAGQIAGGVLGGVFGGLTGTWAAPMVIYLTARRAEKDELVRATGFLIFVGSLPLAVAYAGLEFLTNQLLILSLIMIAPTFVGFSLGEAVRNRLSNNRFQTVFLIVFALLGLNLLRRGLF